MRRRGRAHARFRRSTPTPGIRRFWFLYSEVRLSHQKFSKYQLIMTAVYHLTYATRYPTIAYMDKQIIHPTSVIAREDRRQDKEALARQLRTTKMMAAQAREQINATQLLTEIESIDRDLQGERDVAGNPIPLEREVIAALRARADIKFKLLDKVLPSLKQVESSHEHTHQHAHVHANIDNVELAQRLQMWRKQNGQVLREVNPMPTEKVASAQLNDDPEWL